MGIFDFIRDKSGLGVCIFKPSEVHFIDRPQPPDSFFRVREYAGWELQQKMKVLPGAHWLKAEYTAPAFENLSFAYKNQIFCVLIVYVHKKTGKAISIGVKRDNLVRECKKNNLVPCVYRILVDDFEKPSLDKLEEVGKGWNLLHAETGVEINPAELANDIPIKMSPWELHDFAVQVVRNYITDKLKYKILSYQTVLGIEPQIFFEDNNGMKNWVVVRHVVYPNKEANMPANIFDIMPSLKECNGYFASVGFCSSDMSNSCLYRGEMAMINFQGMKKVAHGIA